MARPSTAPISINNASNMGVLAVMALMQSGLRRRRSIRECNRDKKTSSVQAAVQISFWLPIGRLERHEHGVNRKEPSVGGSVVAHRKQMKKAARQCEQCCCRR